MGRLPRVLADVISSELSNKSVSITEDQKSEILKIRRYWYAISHCLESSYLGRENPFKTGDIKVTHVKFEDFILHWADYYEKLMLLTYKGYPAIEKEANRQFGEFPCNCWSQLFLNALFKEVTDSVEDVLQPYKEISLWETGKTLKYVLNKLPDLPPGKSIPRQLPKMRQSFNQRNYSGWHLDEFSIRFLASSALQQQSCPNRQLTSQCLQLCKAAEKSLFRDFYLPGSRRRGEWARVFSGSYAWKNGNKVLFNPKTKTYSESS